MAVEPSLFALWVRWLVPPLPVGQILSVGLIRYMVLAQPEPDFMWLDWALAGPFLPSWIRPQLDPVVWEQSPVLLCGAVPARADLALWGLLIWWWGAVAILIASTLLLPNFWTCGGTCKLDLAHEPEIDHPCHMALLIFMQMHGLVLVDMVWLFLYQTQFNFLSVTVTSTDASGGDVSSVPSKLCSCHVARCACEAVHTTHLRGNTGCEVPLPLHSKQVWNNCALVLVCGQISNSEQIPASVLQCLNQPVAKIFTLKVLSPQICSSSSKWWHGHFPNHIS